MAKKKAEVRVEEPATCPARCVDVRFMDGTQQDYRYSLPASIKTEPEEGGFVVINVGGNTPKLARVLRVVNATAESAGRANLIGVVDLGDWLTSQKQARRRKEIERVLEEKEREYLKRNRFQILADHDPEAAELLAELADLKGR